MPSSAVRADAFPSGYLAESLRWLNGNWFPAGAVAAVFYLLCLPFHRGWTTLTLLAALQLPMYIVHQIEEHCHDRFRRSINATLGHGLNVLTPTMTMYINVVYVWAVEFATLYLAVFVRPGLISIVFFLTLINALAHLVGSVVTRAYNPGVITAVLLFVPSSVFGIVAFRRAGLMSTADLCIGLACGVAIHVAIIVPVLRRRSTLQHHPVAA